MSPHLVGRVSVTFPEDHEDQRLARRTFTGYTCADCGWSTPMIEDDHEARRLYEEHRCFEGWTFAYGDDTTAECDSTEPT